MGRTAGTYIILVIAGVLLTLYVFKSIEVESKNKEIMDLNDKVKNLNSSFAEHIKMINKLVDERILQMMMGSTETRQYMLDGSYNVIDNQGYDDVYPISIFTDGYGNIILVSATDKIVKFDSNGEEILSVGVGIDVDTFHPSSFDYYDNDTVAVDSNGNIYMLNTNYYEIDGDYDNNLLSIFSKDGRLMKAWMKRVDEKDCYGGYYIEDSFPLVRAIAVYSNGDVAIIGNEVKRFSSDGKFIATYIDPCQDEINFTIDIAIDEDDNLYILGGEYYKAYEFYKVYKLDEDGRIVTSWSIYDQLDPDNYPVEIRTDGGYVYILDVKNIIHIFTDSGSLVDRIDYHLIDDEYNNNSNIIDFAVSNDTIYIIENSSDYTRTIKKIYSDKRVDVWKVYKHKPSDTELHDIAVSKDNIFIALYEDGEIKIYKYDKQDGVKVGEWTVVTRDEYGQEERVRLAHGEGKVAVALYQKGKVKVYDDGKMLLLEEYMLGPILGSKVLDVEMDERGYIYAILSDGMAIMSDGKVVKRLWITNECTIYGYVIPHYKSDDEMHGHWATPEVEWYEAVPAGTNCSDPDGDGPLERGDGQFLYIGSIAVSEYDRFYVLDEGNRRIQVFSKDDGGRFVDKLSFINPSPYHHSVDAIVDMDVDDKGYLYIATGKSVIVIDANDDDEVGKLVAAWGSICYPVNQQEEACSYPALLLHKDSYVHIVGMDVDHDDGHVYIAYSNNIVLRFRPSDKMVD